jgi:hypothetical protein
MLAADKRRSNEYTSMILANIMEEFFCIGTKTTEL